MLLLCPHTVVALLLGEGDVVILHTGWMQKWLKEGDKSFADTEPGIGVHAAQYLADLKVLSSSSSSALHPDTASVTQHLPDSPHPHPTLHPYPHPDFHRYRW
jgi:kynurenine formamidase